MTTKHTQGDWIAHDGQIYPQETGKTLALIPYYDEEDKEQQANERLIAASPDLLHALTKLLHCPDLNFDELETETREAIDLAANAIQKATQP